MDIAALAAAVFDGLYPYLSDPTVLMTIIIVTSVLASLSGRLPWKITGLILILGAVYAKLSEIFGPEAAATIIVSNVVSFTVGRIVQTFKQKFVYEPVKRTFHDDRW
ncbi:TPA: hypothetical protein EYP13_02335 [Candidatus Micrarchaeota archaeon]|nr:hypothetical protein [Candidatus Micrarchaeota archaeon]